MIDAGLMDRVVGTLKARGLWSDDAVVRAFGIAKAAPTDHRAYRLEIDDDLTARWIPAAASSEAR